MAAGAAFMTVDAAEDYMLAVASGLIGGSVGLISATIAANLDPLSRSDYRQKLKKRVWLSCASIVIGVELALVIVILKAM